MNKHLDTQRTENGFSETRDYLALSGCSFNRAHTTVWLANSPSTWTVVPHSEFKRKKLNRRATVKHIMVAMATNPNM